MKSGKPLTRSAWPRRTYAPPPAPPLARGLGGRYSLVAQAVHAVAKSVARRNAHLLAMASGKPCLLRAPGVACTPPDTTVACHSNRGEHGKAAGRKADDHYTVWGCFACHTWLDQGRADGDLKALAFMRAHADQVLAWRAIVMDPAQPAKDRQAAGAQPLERNSSRTGTPAMTTGLTTKQAELLAFMREFEAANDNMPTDRTIAQRFGWASTNSAFEQLRALAKKGYIERNEQGGWRFTRTQEPAC